MALAQSALFPSVVLNYSVFLGQALVSSYCNDFLIICLYVMNEMEMYHHGQTGAGTVPQSGWGGAGTGSHVTSMFCSDGGRNLLPVNVDSKDLCDTAGVEPTNSVPASSKGTNKVSSLKVLKLTLGDRQMPHWLLLEDNELLSAE
ncbi:hypothetical protein Q5P01_009241 [Channa striata]|uniref:Uncharacterized protein n=1 Tax=Channa striata TaxID=64152 RepID=A0AA88STF5_CHASR|nr:hypothetical protein Q5P01_009241 [Channa striata]